MNTLITKYLAWACMAVVAAVMVTGSPTVARETGDLAVLNDLVGVDIDDWSKDAATKYCGNQASGCTWAEGGEPGKTGSPPGTCKSQSGCSDKGTGKGGKECTCCKTYKDADGTTKDCPTTKEGLVLSEF